MRHVLSVATGPVWLGILLVGLPAAQAVVQTIDADVEARVHQFMPDGVVNSDAAFESFDETTSILPMVVEAELSQTDSASTLSAAAARSVFSDPRASVDPNPGEFSFDVVAFSLDPVTDYQAAGNANETRSIVFTAAEIRAEDGTEILVTSHFFLDGFMIVWGDLDPSLGTTEAEMVVRVHQTRPGQDRVQVMEATLSLGLNADGSAELIVGGALSTDNVVFIEVPASTILLGQAYLVALPALSIPYTHQEAVGETFTLEASIECRVRNRPYTGAAVAAGLPLDEFLETIGTTIGEPVTASQVLARTNGEVPTPAKPLAGGQGTQVQIVGSPFASLVRGLPCGGLGIESLLLAAMCPAYFLFRRR